MGDEENESYIAQTDKWRREKLGEVYAFNKKLEFASVPDRSLFLLQQHGISYSFNEMITIQTHDGLYDEGNKKYLMGYMPEQKFRTALPLIVHQADMMAARIEFEKDWLSQMDFIEPAKSSPTTKRERKSDGLKAIASKNTKSTTANSVFDNLFLKS